MNTRTLQTFWVALLGLAVAGASPASPRLSRVPRVMLWAWERPIAFPPLARDVGVAYLAGSIFLVDADVVARPRMQPLHVAPGTTLLAVVRIETNGERRPVLSQEQAQRATEAVLRFATRPAVVGIQVDFDATLGERRFYGRLLAEIRHRMPADWPLSMTALASWCLGDAWIRDLPVDEAVPMLFQMGPDAREVRARLVAGQDFSLPACRASVGLSLEEPGERARPDRRKYVFTKGSWSARAIAEASRR